MKGYWENLRPFEKRVVVGVATGLFVLFNIWFVFPHFGDWDKMKYRLATAERTLAMREAEIKQLPFFERELKKLEKEGLDVPAEEQALQFARTVTDEIARSGVNPSGEGRIQTRTNQFFLELSRTINVQGGEQQMVDFLYNLGSGNSLIRVRDLSLHPDPQTRQQLAATIKLVASYQKNPTAKPAAVPSRATAPKLAANPTPSSAQNPLNQPRKTPAK
jgi:Tfp pilus assembly protein PilO